jgi:hypothetical protein
MLRSKSTDNRNQVAYNSGCLYGVTGPVRLSYLGHARCYVKSRKPTNSGHQNTCNQDTIHEVHIIAEKHNTKKNSNQYKICVVLNYFKINL